MLKIQKIPIKDVKTNPDNPRTIKGAAFKSLVKSLEDCPSLFDARPCICSNRTGELIVLGGNMRLESARKLKYKDVPVIVMEGLTEEQEREIILKDNGTTWGEWNFDKLSSWGDLPFSDWGVPIPEDWLKQPEFEPGPEDDQSRLDELSPKMVKCPHCQTVFDSRGHEQKV